MLDQVIADPSLVSQFAISLVARETDILSFDIQLANGMKAANFHILASFFVCRIDQITRPVNKIDMSYKHGTGDLTSIVMYDECGMEIGQAGPIGMHKRTFILKEGEVLMGFKARRHPKYPSSFFNF